MAHEIDNSKGFDAFVFGQTDGAAWHTLGRPIPAEIAKDPAAIAALCGADYTVAKFPVSYTHGGKTYEVPNREAVVRMDTMETLEVMSGNKYKVPQPVEYFETFRDALAKSHLEISSAAVLKGGRIVMVCARLSDSGISVLETDPLEYYACIGGGYDGKLSHFGFLSALRPVCWNTLSANLGKTSRGKTLFKMPHSAAYDGDVLAAAIGLAGPEIKVQAAVFNKLASKRMDKESVAQYFCRVLDINPEHVNAYDKTGKPLLSTKLRNQLNALADAYLNGPGATLETAAGTAWGALNAVTYYADHASLIRDTTQDGEDASRMASAQFGNGAALKSRALDMAMAAAEIKPEDLLVAA